MSVLAYRVFPSKADTFTFDVGHDERLVGFLNDEIQFYLSLNSYGTGIVDVPIEILNKVLESRQQIKLNSDAVKQIKFDIADALAAKQEVVSYHCF